MSSILIDGVYVETKPIYPNNSYIVRQYFEKFDPAINGMGPWVGASGVTAAFCTDRAGTAIISGLGPFTMLELAGFPGWYTVVISAAQTALLASLVEEHVFQRVLAGPNTELRVVTPLFVAQPRTIF